MKVGPRPCKRSFAYHVRCRCFACQMIQHVCVCVHVHVRFHVCVCTLILYCRKCLLPLSNQRGFDKIKYNSTSRSLRTRVKANFLTNLLTQRAFQLLLNYLPLYSVNFYHEMLQKAMVPKQMSTSND